MKDNTNIKKIIDGIISIILFAPYVMSMCLYLTAMFLSTILMTIGSILFVIKDKLYDPVSNKS